MAVARPSRAKSVDGTIKKKRVVTRTKVLTTAMADDEPVVKKRVVKTTVGKTTVGKTAAAKTRAKPRKATPVWNEPRDPRPGRRSATERLDDPPPATGAELVERVSWAIERELNQIEMIVGGCRVKHEQRTEAERRARTLASLARTLNEVARLRAQHQQRPDNDDAAMPRDLDEFRETLARRLERLLAAEQEPSDGDLHAG